MSSVIQPYLPPSFMQSDRIVHLQAAFPQIDAIYRDYAKENHFPGYAYGILLDGQLVFTGCGGFSDLENRVPATSQSLFRIASMTKSFTAMAIIQLRDEGKIALDAPAHSYIPEMQNLRFTLDAPDITVRDLLNHTEGFPTDDPWADRKLAETPQELVAFLKNGVFFSNSAGTTFEYSNLGYALLGLIIEKVTGTSYQAFIANKIWQPLGMQADWDFAKVAPSQLAQGYRWVDQDWEKEELLADGIFGAMGGMLTSIEAFSKYAALHLTAWPPRDEPETGPLRRSSLREMHRPWVFRDLVLDHKYLDGRDYALTSGYGHGLIWSRDHLKRVYVGHSGGLPGFGSNWSFMPEYGLAVILFANVTYAPALHVNMHVLDRLIECAQLKPFTLPPSQALQEKQTALLKLLPDWEDAANSSLFAQNFFLDTPLEFYRKISQNLFAKAGKIHSVGALLPENQLRGSFTLQGENADLKLWFSLTPENPPLIQQLQINEIAQN